MLLQELSILYIITGAVIISNVNFENTSYTVGEGNGSVLVCLQNTIRSGLGLGTTLTVDYEISMRYNSMYLCFLDSSYKITIKNTNIPPKIDMQFKCMHYNVNKLTIVFRTCLSHTCDIIYRRSYIVKCCNARYYLNL